MALGLLRILFLLFIFLSIIGIFFVVLKNGYLLNKNGYLYHLLYIVFYYPLLTLLQHLQTI
ncbi:hypothetical protein CBU03nite_34530 [Clostridium butyricum]|nr:hypothetical protein ATN24_07975 [Clostridium butyricum]ALS16529.1 hypothetical protein ATD26_06520 [Clostridium butyricum]ANF13693.1 hypothetical protein AZ909_06420 [Clostridium butyricum]AOR93760.1 hypothetical protein BBB49_06600 [Clostridium butyricum]BBK77299.1 hypothetical protein Cbu04g_23070 [Clostridium butyricum]